MRKAVYTVLVGDYDTLKEPEVVDSEWDYICFTDNPYLESNVWDIRLLENEEHLDDALLSRKPKILVHQYLPEYDQTVYIDANYKIINRIEALAGSKRGGIWLSKHPKRNCSYVEGEIVIERKIDANFIVSYQLNKYETEGFPHNYGMYLCSILIRDNSESIKRLMELWWEQVSNYSYRDQVSFTYCCWKLGIKPNQFLDGITSQYFSQCFHKFHLDDDFKVHYITPYGDNKQIGPAINDVISRVDDSDWICLRDGDTMFFDSDYGDYIKDVIRSNPDTHLFGCYTNRLGLEWQLIDGKISDDPNILNHKQIADYRRDKYGTECESIDKPIAGLFMLFPKKVWKMIRFQTPIIDKDGVYFDWRFSSHVLAYNGTVKLIKGLYLFHYYRLHKNRTDVSHII